MINLNILFLKGHEADKLNLYAGIANNLNNDNITMLAFSSYEKSFYKKYTKHKIDFIIEIFIFFPIAAPLLLFGIIVVFLIR